MEDLIILGSGVHACEIVEIIGRINAQHPTWDVLGFLSSDKSEVGKEKVGRPVLGTFEDISDYPQARFVVAEVPNQGKFAKKLGLPSERFATIIDPTCFVSRTAKIGNGCVLYPRCYVGLETRIDDFVFSLSGTIINHHDVIEEGVCITSNVNLAGGVYVERDSYLGAGTMVRGEVRIGAEAYTGMGSVIIKDVAARTVVVGNPARKLRDVEELLSSE